MLFASGCVFLAMVLYGFCKLHCFRQIPVETAVLSGFILLCFSAVLFYIIHNRNTGGYLHSKISQLDIIFNNAPFIIYIKDCHGNIVLANRQFSQSVKLSRKKLTGMNISEIYKNYIPVTEIPVSAEKTTTERCLEQYNGTKNWFKITQVPVFDTLCNLSGIIVFLVNIDKDKVLEENKTSFVATLTHDLKTPTLALISASDLLLSGLFGNLNGEQHEIISQIKTSCDYMKSLIFTILDTYLYDSGQAKIKPEKFDMVNLVNQTVSELTNLTMEKGQKINIHSAAKSVYTTADKFQIKRVIVNLLGNAINYGFKNTTIDIDISDRKNDIMLNIKNKSQYIPKDRIKEIFAKYKQKSTSQYSKTGTGLGLYLSKQIIDAHNGKVYAKSSFNQVCDFGFRLPKDIPSEITTCKK